MKVKEKEAEGDRRRACREKNCFGALGSMTTTSLRKPDFVSCYTTVAVSIAASNNAWQYLGEL